MLSALCIGWVGLGLTAMHDVSVIFVGLALFSSAVFVAQAILANRLGEKKLSPVSQVSGYYLFFYYFGGALGALLPSFLWNAYGWNGCLMLIFILQLTVLVFTSKYWCADK